MNKFEYLYHKKQLLEKEIAKNNLFKLSKREAIQCVIIKVGILFFWFARGTNDKKQKYMKKLIRTNATHINEISFLQESLKWICRWCSEYCADESEYDGTILANQVYELMGLAYAYDEFIKYSFYHSKHIVSYNIYGNSIQFDYINQESHQVHVLYDTLNRDISEKKAYLECLFNNVDASEIERIETIHRSDFSFDYDFNFGKFSLKDYEEFSVALNNYIMNKMFNRYALSFRIEGVCIWKKVDLVNMLVEVSGIDKEKVEEMIAFFKYDIDDKHADLSLNYFFELDNERIILSEAIFNMQRPAVNALRILAKRQSKLYETEQNMFEVEQKNRIKEIVGKSFLVAKNLTKEQKIRPGMDMLVYDKNSNHLQVLELKYKIPVDSERDIVNLDEMLEKAYAQLEWAKQYVAEHEGILEEYFGTEYIGVIPNVVDYFVVTNYAIGTGTNCKLPSPILLEEHYLQLMQQDAGMQYVHKALLDKKKCIVGEIKKRYARYALVGFKIKIPETIMEEKGEIEFPLTCMNYF